MNYKYDNVINIRENYKLVDDFDKKHKINSEEEEDLNYYEYENSNNLNNYSFLRFLKFDLKRKVKLSDISFESEEFDINNPYYSSEEEEEKNKLSNEKTNNEIIDFDEILTEIHKLSQNNFNKNEKLNEELNFSNNCFPYKTMVYNSEMFSSENLSIMQNVSEINQENNYYNYKRPDIDNSDRNINFNEYSFSRINSVNHSYNISSIHKRASNQTIETINKNSIKNGFYSN